MASITIGDHIWIYFGTFDNWAATFGLADFLRFTIGIAFDERRRAAGFTSANSFYQTASASKVDLMMLVGYGLELFIPC